MKYSQLAIHFDMASKSRIMMKPCGMRIRRINAHCVCIDLVGRVITIRSAYKGMHQGGNKSGAHRESICFHLHGRPARMGRRGGRNTRREGTRRGRRRRNVVNVEFSSGGTAKSRELFMERLLKSHGRRTLHSQNMFVRATCYRGKRPPLAISQDPCSRCFSCVE